MATESKPSGLVQGTLHMLILKTLTLEPLHGYGIGVRLAEDLIVADPQILGGTHVKLLSRNLKDAAAQYPSEA